MEIAVSLLVELVARGDVARLVDRHVRVRRPRAEDVRAHVGGADVAERDDHEGRVAAARDEQLPIGRERAQDVAVAVHAADDVLDRRPERWILNRANVSLCRYASSCGAGQRPFSSMSR